MLSQRQTARVIFSTAVIWSMAIIPGLSMEKPGMSAFPKDNTSVESIQRDLKLAACMNDWNRVVDLMGALMASPAISPEHRAELIKARHDLQGALLNQDTIAISAQRCEALQASYLPLWSPVSPPLHWDSALYSGLVSNEFDPLPDQVARQRQAAQQARLTQIIDTEIPPLSPARLVSTHNGSGISAGAVSTGVNIFAFVGAGGDQISLNISVTDVFPGRLYADEDSQLFLFDSEGTLLAENDDLSRLQSQITDFPLPQTGRYYVAVTTYNNDPILDSNQRITGWNGNGGSSIEYTLTLTGLTPAGQLVPPTASQPEG